jgi:signal peptidase II
MCGCASTARKKKNGKKGKLVKSIRIFSITVAVFAVDQLTKWLIHHSMKLYQSIPVLGDFFRITYIENSGMAFGLNMGQGSFFTVFAVIASLGILIYLYKMKGERFAARFSMAMILGGAIGNLWDRIVRGSVVDFLDAEFFDIHIPAFKALFIKFPGYSLERWPVFNVADIAITLGMISLAIFVLFEKEKKPVTNLETEIIH